MGQHWTKSENRDTPDIVVTGSFNTGTVFWQECAETTSRNLDEPIFPGQEAVSPKYKGLTVYGQVYNSPSGGRFSLRPFLTYYLRHAKGVVFIVDSTGDTEALQSAKWHLREMLVDDLESKDTIIALVANKQDLPGAKSLEEIEELMTMDLNVDKRHFKVFPMDVSECKGLTESFDWMVTKIEKGQTTKAAVEPWKEVAGDMTKNGKTSFKLVKKNWKTFTSAFPWRHG